MIGLSTILADPAAGDAIEDVLEGDFHEDDVADLATELREACVERIGLRCRAGKAIEEQPSI